MSLLKEVSINSSIYAISLSLGGGVKVQIFEADVIFIWVYPQVGPQANL